MLRRPRRTVLVNVFVMAFLALAGAMTSRAQEATPAASPVASPGVEPSAALLPREIILPIDEVQEVVPEMATETATGENTAALGEPVATRLVIFTTADGRQRLVLSVDHHRSAAHASATFQEAAARSQEIQGVEGEPVPNLGEAAFIGIVTRGDETHVGGGALFAVLIVNATLQGYEGTDANKAAVTELIDRQADHAEELLQPAATPTAPG